MNYEDLRDAIVEILDSKKASDIVSIPIGKKSSLADFFVIATGKNTTHVKALAGALEEKLKTYDIVPSRIDGIQESRWVVLDYNDVIVHIFNDETRDFYCLEQLWKDKIN